MSDLTVTDRFVYALAGCQTREDAAWLYATALGGEVEWPIVNRLIISRWSKNGLSYIKERAWKIAESVPETDKKEATQ